MKKHLKYISALMLAGTILGSCESDEGYRDDPTYIGGYATLADGSISVFDTNADLNIDLFTDEGVSFESININSDGEMLGSASLVDENSATMNTSIFGTLEADSAIPVRLMSNLSNGNTADDPFTLSVNHAVSFDSDENPASSTLDSIGMKSLMYEVSTFEATVDDLMFEIKKNSDSDYNDTDLNANIEGDSISLENSGYEDLDFAVGDTLYYRFTASSGNLTDTAEDYMVIVRKAFMTESSVDLSNSEMTTQADLELGENVEQGGDIMYMEPNGFSAAEDSDIQFVNIDQDDFYANADVNAVQEAYINGTKATSVTDLSQGDAFVYSISRDDMTFFGKMRISNVSVANEDETTIQIEYAEGR